MGELAAFLTVVLIIAYIVIKSYEKYKYSPKAPTNKQLKQHTLDKVALKNKYGNERYKLGPNEYHEERKKLEEEFKKKWK